MPRSSVTALPPVSTAMSSSMALRRSPYPGALTAATFSVPRSLLTTSVASASPSMSSAMISSGRPACADLLQQRQQILHGADLLLVDQDERILEHDFHALGIGHEIRREIAAIELHALDHFQRGVERLALFDGDHAVLADLLHGLGDDLADGFVVVRRDGADLRDHRPAHRLGHPRQLRCDRRDGLLDAALERHRVGAGGDVLRALAIDRLGQDRGGRGAVAGHVRGLARHLLDHLRAHVLERVLQLDLLRDGDAVLGDRRRPERPCRG